MLVKAALLGALDVPGTETDYVSLAGKTINGCDRCDDCIVAGECLIGDDMQPLYEKLLRADAIIIGTPVYFGSPSSLTKAFMERIEGLGVTQKRLRLKVGGAIAVGGSRNGGQETTMIAINMWCHINDMLPVGMTAPVASWGMAGNAGHDPEDINNDRFRLSNNGETVDAKEAAWLYGRKIATVTAIVRAGRDASGLDLPDRPYGWTLPDAYPDALYHLGDE